MNATDTVSQAEADSIEITRFIRESGLWRLPGEEHQERSFRVSPRPFPLPDNLIHFLEQLGPALLRLYQATNSLYLKGPYSWVREYLDLGKTESLIEHGRMNYQKGRIPVVIRPDILLSPDSYAVTELDSVPGGVGLMAGLSQRYADLGHEVLGGRDGMLRGFAEAVMSTTEKPEPTVAIVVSEESASYRPEMQWLAEELRKTGYLFYTIEPQDIHFTEDGLYFEWEGKKHDIDVLYRFYELFDLKNIPKAELITYASKKRKVIVTPPYKHYLEEKMLLALFHHPRLQSYWKKELGEEHFELLEKAIPPTWILDPRPLPPNAIIPGFEFRGEPINDWRTLKDATQKERKLVIKPSGFSPLAWGSHGVVIGHDVSLEHWAETLDSALAGFENLPYVLQPFREGRKFEVEYLQQNSEQMTVMQGRVRLSPYYFVRGDSVCLGGALAAICPPDKKLIHGMVDAVMVPSAPARETFENA